MISSLDCFCLPPCALGAATLRHATFPHCLAFYSPHLLYYPYCYYFCVTVSYLCLTPFDWLSQLIEWKIENVTILTSAISVRQRNTPTAHFLTLTLSWSGAWMKRCVFVKCIWAAEAERVRWFSHVTVRGKRKESSAFGTSRSAPRLPLVAAAETTESAIGACCFRSAGGQRSSPVSFCVIPFYK